MTTTPEPTVGRIVLYSYYGKDVPAIVVTGGYEGLTLCVFSPTGPMNYFGVTAGYEDGQWHWPEIKKEQHG